MTGMKQLGWLAIGVLASCGTHMESTEGFAPGQVGEIEEPLSTGESCHSIDPAANSTGIPYAYSNDSYNPAGCGKGYIVDLTSWAPSEYSAGTFVSWADHRVPTTMAA